MAPGTRMKLDRWFRIALQVLLFLLACAVSLTGLVVLYFHPPTRCLRGLVYGERHGRPLTMDVAFPASPNGRGVLLMMSGSWKSRPGSFRPWLVAPLLRRGYTVFAIYHVSQPEATVMEIVEDVCRAARHVHQHASEYGVDPQSLGVTGGSSGGHLALMLATGACPGETQGTPGGDAPAGLVRAAAVFFPVTDLLNLGASTENAGDGGPPRSFVRAFGPQATNLAQWRAIGRSVSPIYHVHPHLPPILILHGDADTLVPLEQSLRFQEAARRLGGHVEVRVKPGGRHGWWTLPWDIRAFADWFDRHMGPPAFEARRRKSLPRAATSDVIDHASLRTTQWLGPATAVNFTAPFSPTLSKPLDTSATPPD
jgi:acetyl esterase/lipase